MRTLPISWIVALAIAAPATAQFGWPPECLDGFDDATSVDVLSLTVGGEWPVNCPPNFGIAELDGDTISVTLQLPHGGPFCNPVVVPWSVTVVVGPIPAGDYSVVTSVVDMYGNPTHLGPDEACTLTVAEGCAGTVAAWSDEIGLLDDDVADQRPFMTVHDDELHLAWRREDVFRYGVLSGHTLNDLGPLADAPSSMRASAALASYQGSLFAFYPGDTELYGRNLTDGSPEFSLTLCCLSNTGPATVVHGDLLYVFWADGNALGYQTFDGTTWSRTQIVVPSGGLSERPAVASFQGQLYLFYVGGSSYRVFDGIVWSDEQDIPDVAALAVPAACVYDGTLRLFYSQSGVDGYFVRQIAFDGLIWTLLGHVMPASGLVRDLAAAVQGDRMIVFRGEEFVADALVMVQASRPSADLDGDGIVGVSDLLEVVINWGPCVPMDEPCPGDTNGDCDVDVNDIVEVIAGWG